MLKYNYLQNCISERKCYDSHSSQYCEQISLYKSLAILGSFRILNNHKTSPITPVNWQPNFNKIKRKLTDQGSLSPNPIKKTIAPVNR